MASQLCEIVAALAFAAAVLLFVVVACNASAKTDEGFRAGYLPAYKSTSLMTGPSWNRVNVHKNSDDWEPIGMAALLPLFGNVLRYNYVLEKKEIANTSQFKYRVRRLDGTVILPIVESRELTDGAIINIAAGTNPYADTMIVSIPPKKVEAAPPFPEADIVNFP